MMVLHRIRPIYVWSLVLLASAIVLWTTARTALAASRQMTADHQRLTSVTARDQEAQLLQERVAEWATRMEGSDAALAPRLTEVLTASGLSPSSLSSVSPQGDQVLASNSGSQAVRTKASATLTGVTLRRLGVFLNNWKEKNPGWVVTSLDLSPEAPSIGQPGSTSAGSPSQGGDLPIRVLMTIESLRLERKGQNQ